MGPLSSCTRTGAQLPSSASTPMMGGMATFTLFQVTPTDNGTYRCSYLIKGYFPLLSSPLGDNVTLEVTPTSAHPGRCQLPFACSQ